MSHVTGYTKNGVKPKSKHTKYQPLEKIMLNPQLTNSAAFN